MTKGIFVTATGTDVGKTYISALLVKKLRKLGFNCGYYKPALSGALFVDGHLEPGDCKYVLETAGINANPTDFASYIFKTPVSPHLASILEGEDINTTKIKQDFEKKKAEFDYIVTEGAGGIACPFKLSDEKIMIEDIIKMLHLDVLIVASAELGTINYTYLTVHYLKSIGIGIKGIILNNYDANNIMCKDNKHQVERLTGIKVIATVKQNDKDLEIDKETLLSIFKEI